jgi:fatty-acyl-CoA synthase
MAKQAETVSGKPGLLPGQIRGQMMDRPLLISPLMPYADKFHGDTEIVTQSVEGPIHRTTWRQIHTRAQQIANALIAMGVKPGDRVATLAWNTWRHVELYYAISGIGAVCHTLNPRLSNDQICFIINDAQDSVVFFDLTFKEGVPQIAAGARSVRKFVALSDGATLAQANIDPAHKVEAYEDVIADKSPFHEWPEFCDSAAASLCYTSGTTGNPKGVLYSHRAIMLHTYSIVISLGFSAEDVICPIVPMFHVNAWGVPYGAAMVGAKLMLPGRHLDGRSLFNLMDDEGVTVAMGVPTVWMSILDVMRQEGRKPRGLKRLLIGGSAMSESMIAAFDSYGIDARHGWGMTELSPLGCVNTLKPKYASLSDDEKMRIKLKQGRVSFGVDMRVVDENNTPLPNDGLSAGRLQVQGPFVIDTYYNAAQSALTPDGWFDTGDIATIDPDGYMQITDRAKDVIKSGGEWISSVDLENAAMGCPGIAQAAVIGVPHPRWQERPLLICVPSGAARPSLQEINAYLAGKVPKWWLPDAVTFVETLPLGATGKVQKSELRVQFKDFALSDPILAAN